MLSDVPRFFGLESPGAIAWAHAVNSQAKLAEFAARADTHVLEGDISFLPDAGGVMMAHPPETASDLAFEDWIERTAASGKGAKLDFKSPEAIEPCLAKLADMRRAGRLPIPIFLNADVLQGPGGNAPRFQAEAFVRRCSAVPDAILSLGWTTQYVEDGAFADDAALQMLRLAAAVMERTTVCLRACYLARSGPALARLAAAPGVWLTIWNGRQDPVVRPAAARRLTDPARSFYDLIDADGRPLV